MRGNIVDLAVAVIIGGAFGKIVTSFVNDILMPLLGTVIGDSFASLTMTINGVAVKYGSFLQSIVDFVIIAACIFIVIKGIEKTKKKEEEAPAAPPAPTKDQVLLEEIRDLLKK